MLQDSLRERQCYRIAYVSAAVRFARVSGANSCAVFWGGKCLYKCVDKLRRTLYAVRRLCRHCCVLYSYIESWLQSGSVCCRSVQNRLSSSGLSENITIKAYRTIILFVVLYGCETWSFALREERRLRVYENRVLRRIFGHKREEDTHEWRKLHNEELYDLYCSPDIFRVIE